MATRSQQISAALASFYEKPVAVVSLELLLSLGLIILLGVFAIQPTLVTMTDLIKEIDDKKTLNEQLQKKVTSLQTAQTVYAKVEPRLYLLEEAVPSKPELVRTLKIIEKLATENGVVILSASSKEIPLETSASTLTPKRQAQPLTVSVTGDYPSIRSFANALLESRRTFTIDTIGFSLVENRSERGLNASLTINAPYYGEPTQ